MTSYTIPNNMYLAKEALKYAEGLPTLETPFLSLEPAVGLDPKACKE